MKIVGLIPARYQSSRLPGKPLVRLLGKPMVIHVAEKVSAALGLENTYIVTDDELIQKTAEEYGFQTIMTSSTCLTGTDRLYEACLQLEADVYVNIQGDEPMVSPVDISRIAEEKIRHPEMVINGYAPLSHDEDPWDKNIPKVLFNSSQNLIYMSRLPLPGTKKENDSPRFYKQICIYAFSRADLKAFGECKEKAEFEFFEDIEIDRFFDLGIPIKMVECRSTKAVDIPKDVGIVEELMRSQNK